MKALNSLNISTLAERSAARMVNAVNPPVMRQMISSLIQKRKAAFTLVEVVLSLGVVSFVLVSMVGLLPVGMATQRQATSNMVESQIVQSLTNEILLTDFDNLQNQQTLSYDREGKLLSSNGPSTDANSLYDVTVTLQSVNTANAPVNLKTSAKDQAYNVAILVRNRSRPSEPGKYSVIVARTTL